MSNVKSPLPKLVLNRNYTLTSLYGHVVQFVKGEPTYVPPSVYQEALSIGATPENGQEIDAFVEERKEDIPLSPIERSTKLQAAIETLIERNNRTDFTAAGAPSRDAIARLAGFTVNQKELNSEWQRYHEKKAEEAND
jgi:hypothetical protein